MNHEEDDSDDQGRLRRVYRRGSNDDGHADRRYRQEGRGHHRPRLRQGGSDTTDARQTAVVTMRAEEFRVLLREPVHNERYHDGHGKLCAVQLISASGDNGRCHDRSVDACRSASTAAPRSRFDAGLSGASVWPCAIGHVRSLASPLQMCSWLPHPCRPREVELLMPGQPGDGLLTHIRRHSTQDTGLLCSQGPPLLPHCADDGVSQGSSHSLRARGIAPLVRCRTRRRGPRPDGQRHGAEH